MRLLMEAKLAYVAKHLLTFDDGSGTVPPAFATMGSLEHDGYLTPEEAGTAVGLLTYDHVTFDALPRLSAVRSAATRERSSTPSA